MSKIKFFALGGLGENGKNMYVCEVDESIFILDAGLKYPSVDMLGVDSVYPSMEYLEENSNKIKGIFLSHGHEDNIGAVIEVLKRFNISVFATHFTISVLEDNIQEAVAAALAAGSALLWLSPSSAVRRPKGQTDSCQAGPQYP